MDIQTRDTFACNPCGNSCKHKITVHATIEVWLPKTRNALSFRDINPKMLIRMHFGMCRMLNGSFDGHWTVLNRPRQDIGLCIQFARSTDAQLYCLHTKGQNQLVRNTRTQITAKICSIVLSFPLSLVRTRLFAQWSILYHSCVS